MEGQRQQTVKAALFIPLLPLLAALSFFIWGNVYANRALAGFSGKEAGLAAFEQTSFLYGEDGALITEIHGAVNRVPVPLEEVPLHVQSAFVAVEDERFYSHHGVDIRAILRAAYSSLQSGRITEGASTITQQVIKLYFLSPEQSLRRKMKEAVLAVEFERRYSKDKILELYLNRVYFGEGAYGIQSAAKVYFDKDSSALTVAEGALLAALLQAPSAYDPYINPGGALGRRNTVLEKMIQQKLIPEEQGLEALNTPVLLDDKAHKVQGSSFFIDYVIEEAIEATGSEKFSKGGLKIYTTLEPEIQAKAEEVFRRPDLFPTGDVEAALALVENGTGAIKALVGGRQYEANRGFNRATQLSRQPGSAFKPVAVYAPAFELGYGPESMVSDAPLNISGYKPHNSDGGYYGTVSARTALRWSRNVAAVWLLNQIGVDRGFEMAERMGFELVEEDRCLPLALGGLTRGVSPLQMAGAYAVFSNRGVFIKPYAIKSIVEPGGEVVYRRPEGVPVMKASTAEAMQDMLRSVVEGGTGYRAAIRGVTVAGKTGTTELPDIAVFRGLAGNKDAWFVGFTSRYTAAVWMGYDEKDMDQQHYLTAYGGNQPAELFRTVMARVLNLDERRWVAAAGPPLQEKEPQGEVRGADKEKMFAEEAKEKRETAEAPKAEKKDPVVGTKEPEEQKGIKVPKPPEPAKPVQPKTQPGTEPVFPLRD